MALPRPQLEPPAGRAWRNGLFVVALTVLLGALLIPTYVTSWIGFPSDILGQLTALTRGQLPEDAPRDITQAWSELVKAMLHPYLAPALGFLWVLQRRSVDFSVWSAFCLGAAVGARATAGGGHPLTALLVVVLSGLGLGLVNAAGASLLRLPAWLVTLGTGTLAVSLVAHLNGGGPFRLAAQDLARWSGGNRPLVLSLTFYATGMLSAMALARRPAARRQGHLGPGQSPPAVERPSSTVLAAALIGSGVLSALGGLCWLAKSGEAPMPNFVVGDLRVPAAAILAGGVVMLGREARTLSGLLLPVALLLATIWRQRVFDVPSASFALNLLLLMAMVASCQWVVWHVRRIGVLWLAAGVLGILIVGYTVRDLPPPAARALHVIGLSVWLAAMAGAVARFLRRRKPPAPGDATTPQ